MKQPKFKGWLIVALVSFTLTIGFGLATVLAGSKSLIRMTEDQLQDDFMENFMSEDQLGNDFMENFMGEDFKFKISEDKHGSGYKLNLEDGENSVTFNF